MEAHFYVGNYLGKYKNILIKNPLLTIKHMWLLFLENTS